VARRNKEAAQNSLTLNSPAFSKRSGLICKWNPQESGNLLREAV